MRTGWNVRRTTAEEFFLSSREACFLDLDPCRGDERLFKIFNVLMHLGGYEGGNHVEIYRYDETNLALTDNTRKSGLIIENRWKKRIFHGNLDSGRADTYPRY